MGRFYCTSAIRRVANAPLKSLLHYIMFCRQYSFAFALRQASNKIGNQCSSCNIFSKRIKYFLELAKREKREEKKICN